MAKRRLSDSTHEEPPDFHGSNMILCDESPCYNIWIPIDLYSSHVEQLHQHVCLQCHKNLVKEYWLELHTEEMHNPFNLKPVFNCLEENCSLKFETQEQRISHLKLVHYYPSTFNFSILEISD